MKFIYALLDPRDCRVQYVGVTSNVDRRVYQEYSEAHLFQSHVAGAKSNDTRCGRWIAGLLNKNLLPLVTTIEQGDWTVDEASERERYWIEYFRTRTLAQANIADGGYQVVPSFWVNSTEEQQKARNARISASYRARTEKRKSSPRPGFGGWNKGISASEDSKAKTSSATRDGMKNMSERNKLIMRNNMRFAAAVRRENREESSNG